MESAFPAALNPNPHSAARLFWFGCPAAVETERVIMHASVTESTGFPGETFALKAYLTQQGTGDPVTQASVTSIAYSVFNRATGVSVGTGSVSKTDVIYDTMQTGDDRFEGSSGYNLSWSPLAALMPAGRDSYRFLLTFSMADGSVFVVPHDRHSSSLGAP